MTYHKNWLAICAEENPWLRMYVATETVEEMLCRLEIAFPEFFSVELQSIHVPLSVLVEHMKATEAQLWRDTLSYFCIPQFGWHSGIHAFAKNVPDEFHDLMRRLAEPYDDEYVFMLKDTAVHYIEYHGEKCVVVEVWFDGLNYPENLSIVPARFIDLDS